MRDLAKDQNATVNIAAKVDAVGEHLRWAASYPVTTSPGEEGQLLITFTSAEHNDNNPPITPVIMAFGNGTESTPAGGVNRRLVREILPTLRGKRVGIVIIDFWDSLGPYGDDEEVDVVGAILDL